MITLNFEPWTEQALCNQTDPDAFFPEKGGSTRAAKRTCASCDVRAECLEYALDHGERFGIWGGLSETERHQLERTRTRPPCTAADCDKPLHARELCRTHYEQWRRAHPHDTRSRTAA